jgi:hypothetical protein
MTTDTLGSGKRLAAIILELDGLRERRKSLTKIMAQDTVAELEDARRAIGERMDELWQTAVSESRQQGQLVMATGNGGGQA